MELTRCKYLDQVPERNALHNLLQSFLHFCIQILPKQIPLEIDEITCQYCILFDRLLLPPPIFVDHCQYNNYFINGCIIESALKYLINLFTFYTLFPLRLTVPSSSQGRWNKVPAAYRSQLNQLTILPRLVFWTYYRNNYYYY